MYLSVNNYKDYLYHYKFKDWVKYIIGNERTNILGIYSNTYTKI